MPPELLPLRRRSEFLRVAGGRRKWVAPGLILQARPCPAGVVANDGDERARVGFTVSRKVGNAVKRNRARRRLRAAVRQVMPDHARAGYDFVVVGRSATLTRPFDSLLRDLESALKHLDAYRDPFEETLEI